MSHTASDTGALSWAPTVTALQSTAGVAGSAQSPGQWLHTVPWAVVFSPPCLSQLWWVCGCQCRMGTVARAATIAKQDGPSISSGSLVRIDINGQKCLHNLSSQSLVRWARGVLWMSFKQHLMIHDSGKCYGSMTLASTYFNTCSNVK